jgi:hypothetical protein
MAHGNVTVVNSTTGETKNLPVGYSWTVLFWGCFPALFRQDWKNAGIMAAVLVVSSFLFLAWIPLIIFSFVYNEKMCLKDHLNQGWKIKGYTGQYNLQYVAQKMGYDFSRYMAETT